MAGFLPQEYRPLKRPRLGAPDVYPQDPKQKEDELTAQNAKFGFSNKPLFSEEHGSARKCHINRNKFGANFSSILAEKQKLNTCQDSSRKKSQVSKDNFLLVNQIHKSKGTYRPWFQDLAGSKSLNALSRKVPWFNQRNDIFIILCDFEVPMSRAAWFLKMTAAYAGVAQSENRMKKRQPNDPSQEWCQLLTKFLKEQLAKITDYHQTYGPLPSNAASSYMNSDLNSHSSMSQEAESALKLWQYNTKLARFLYEEGMLECHDYLAWTVDTLEKIKPSDDITLRFMLPYIMQFAEEFVKSQMLSRRLAYYCASRLSSLIDDALSGQTCQNTSGQVPSGSSNQNMFQALFTEYLGCPQHRTIILGLGTLLQCITIKCPSAVIWINSSDVKDKHLASPGSPLDILPFPPSSLPISEGPNLQNHQIRGALRNMETQIKVRSRAVELRWSSDKCQDSATGHTISKELQTLEHLDKHNFAKCDSNNSLDSLYHKIFPGVPQREGSEVPFGDEPVMLLLCSWAVCPQRSGEHRAFVATHLLERRMVELEDEKNFDQEQLESKSGALMNQFLENQTPPIFQRILQEFLDNHAPVADENSSPEERRAFSSLILLFSQLIQNEVFSLDSYMCLLISRGNLINSIPLGVPSDQDLDGHGRTQGKEVKDEVDDGKEDSSDRSDDYDIFDKPPPAPAPPQDMGAQENQTYQSFQQKFVMETLQNQKYESNSDVYDDDQDSQESEDQEKKSEEDSRSPSPQAPKINRHLVYAKHFPLPQGEISSHETNQRLLLLYGYGKVRKEVRSYIRGVRRDIIQLLSDQKSDPTRNSEIPEKRLKLDSGDDIAIAKLQLLPYFDQHILTTAAAKHILERVQTCTRSGWETLPSLEQIICLLDLLEDALNIHGMLEFIVKLLDHINALDSDVLKERAPENYTTNVCLSIVGVLRRYQACLLGSKDQTATIFELLCGVVKHVSNVTNCTSAERCILAYLYDLYMSCSFLKVKFSDMFSSVASKVKEKLYTNIQPSDSNLKWNENYMQEYIENPKSRKFNLSTLGKQLSENSVNRYSFVCNALIAICNTGSMERIRDLSILCAELTASCNGLISEWLGVLRALCCSSNHGCGFTDLLCEVDKVDVSDTSTHDKIAMFTAILIARHCFSLDDVVEHVAMASLIAATPSFSGAVETDTDAEPGARLMCHLLLRLFCSSLVGGAISSQPDEQTWMNILSSCDRHLLEAAHRGISVEPLVGVLKALLLIGDYGDDGGGTSLFDTADDIAPEEASPLGNRPGGTIESASLRTYAKYTLKTICAQECVREICLKEPERLLSPEVLLDQLLSQKQMHYLLHLICYPNGVPSIGAKTSDNEQKQTIERILKTLDQWALRISLLELQLMLKQSSGQSEITLLDNISKATMEVFHHQQSGNKTKPSRASRKRQEQERNSIWLVAPLISKLSSSVQGRVLRSAAIILESVGQTWTVKPGTKDKQEKRSNQLSLASPQPLLSLVLTCLKGQDDQKEGLLASLQTQLTQFLQTPKDDRWEDPKSHQLMHEALQLRLSLVGNMFDTIMRSNTWTTEFAILLLQLITSGPIDVKSTPELFTTVLDMMNVLVNSTLSSDPGASPGAGDESKQHQQLIKKLKKELGDKRSEGIDRMRQLLPVPRRTVEVLTCEPMGSLIDTKGNKITGFDSIIKKQGLQVASKQKVTPWDMLELPKSQGPLSWSWFGGVRMERKPLQYHEQYRLSLLHSHYNQLPDDHFMNPPPLPPDEDLPPPPPEPETEIKEPVTPKPSGDVSSSKVLGLEADKAKPKRKARKRKSTSAPRDQHLNFPSGMQTAYSENHHQSPIFHSLPVPYQQPLPPAGPIRAERPIHSGGRQALRDMLAKQNNPAQQIQHQFPIISKHDDVHKHFDHHQHRNINLPNNPGMFPAQFKNQLPDSTMHHINQTHPSQVYNRNFASPMMQPTQLTNTHHQQQQQGGAAMNYSQYPNQAQVNPAQMMPGMRQPHPHRSFISQQNMSTPAIPNIVHQRIRQRSMRTLMNAGADQGMQSQHQGAPATHQQAYNLQHQLPPQQQQQQHPDQQRLLQMQQQQQLMKIQQPNMNLMQQLQTPGNMTRMPHGTMTPPRAGPGSYQYQ